MILMLAAVKTGFAQDGLIREERKVSAFEAVRASGIASVYLEKGSREKVVIEVNDKKFIDRLKVEVVKNVLVIRTEKGDKWENSRSDLTVKVFVTYTNLKRLEGSGATNFFADDQINTEEFVIKLSGANNTKLNIKSGSLQVETSGASNLTLTGQADDLGIKSAGASNVKAYDLKAGEVHAETSGVANVYVSAQDELEVKASGLSNINYKGNAKVITREVSKMANVTKH